MSCSSRVGFPLHLPLFFRSLTMGYLELSYIEHFAISNCFSLPLAQINHGNLELHISPYRWEFEIAGPYCTSINRCSTHRVGKTGGVAKVTCGCSSDHRILHRTQPGTQTFLISRATMGNALERRLGSHMQKFRRLRQTNQISGVDLVVFWRTTPQVGQAVNASHVPFDTQCITS